MLQDKIEGVATEDRSLTNLIEIHMEEWLSSIKITRGNKRSV